MANGQALFFLFGRYGVVAAFKEGITPQQSPQGEGGAFPCAVYFDSFQRIGGAGRGKPTAPVGIAREMVAVKTDTAK